MGICNYQLEACVAGEGQQLLPEGWHFICHGGGGQPAASHGPTSKAMLDLGLHGTYLDLL